MVTAQEITIPTIDISPLRHGDQIARQEVAAQIDSAFRGNGFFYAANHSVDLLSLIHI